MRLLAKDLKDTGRLREDLSIEMTADILWSMNSPEYSLVLVEQRRWSPKQFEVGASLDTFVIAMKLGDTQHESSRDIDTGPGRRCSP